MKTRILILTLFVLSILVYSYYSPPTMTSALQFNNENEYLFGALSSGYDLSYVYLDSVGFNSWHLYGGSRLGDNGRHYPDGWTHPDIAPGDSLFSNYNAYVGQIQNVLTGVYSHRMKALMMRPKIEWLCYGQRSDYQCENISGDLWFYSFNEHETGIQETDSGQGVIHCRTFGKHKGNDNPGFVVKRLKANTEQCNSGSEYRGDSECEWFIKPRIRIDSAFANNQANWDKLVCRVDIKNQDNNLIKNIDIRVRNFKQHQDSIYKGNYIEKYYFDTQGWHDTSTQNRTGNWGNGWVYAARGNGPDTGYNHADIQVWWYGQCEMRIDYVRVDNDIANDLFGAGQTHNLYMNWLEWEAKDIACYLGGAVSYNFYIELFEYNNIPSMSYVCHVLDSIVYSNCTKHISLMCIPLPFTFSAHVPWGDRLSVQNIYHYKEYFLNKLGANEFLLGFFPFNSSYKYPETYPYNTWTKIPNTLPNHTGTGTLARDTTPTGYDDWLQDYLDHTPYCFENAYAGWIRNPVQEDPGGFRYAMQFGDSLSKATGKLFIYNPQGQIWFCRCGATGSGPPEITGEVQREPTNEEFDMTANVAVSYGARGLTYFQFVSGQNNIGDIFYDRGLMEPWNPINGQRPRYINIYGQKKWDKLKIITNRIKNLWGPALMSFNDEDRHSYIYRLENERNTLITNSYLSWIVSGAKGYPQLPCIEWGSPGIPPPPFEPNLIYDCKQYTYVQVATFEKSGETNTNYFMLVNRRCSPYIDETSEENRGGKRKIKALFDKDHPQMKDYNLWNITDIANSNWAVTFDKSAQRYIDFGWFEPGEGKLYKMTPVGNTNGIVFRLSQNYPNPFNPNTKISFDIPKNLIVNLIVYDVLGKKVKTLINNELTQRGRHIVEFNGINYASGVYFVRIEAGEFTDSKKMILVK
jgi:hypothetical protein